MTDEKIISLGEARAHQKDDARAWTPLEALKSLVRRIEEGEINPVAITAYYWDKDANGKEWLRHASAGLTAEQHVALLVLAQREALESWRG